MREIHCDFESLFSKMADRALAVRRGEKYRDHAIRHNWDNFRSSAADRWQTYAEISTVVGCTDTAVRHHIRTNPKLYMKRKNSRGFIVIRVKAKNPATEFKIEKKTP